VRGVGDFNFRALLVSTWVARDEMRAVVDHRSTLKEDHATNAIENDDAQMLAAA